MCIETRTRAHKQQTDLDSDTGNLSLAAQLAIFIPGNIEWTFN